MFIVEISKEIAELLLSTKEGTCSYEYDNGRLYASIPVHFAQDNASTDSVWKCRQVADVLPDGEQQPPLE